MVDGDQNSEAPAANAQESEIDRIIREIEDLEKSAEEGSTKEDSEVSTAAEAPENVEESSKQNKVAKLRPLESPLGSIEPQAGDSESQSNASDRLASSQQNSLGLRVAGCSEIVLEFTRAEVTVTLSCDEHSLTISTDQGAEFRVPFKHAA